MTDPGPAEAARPAGAPEGDWDARLRSGGYRITRQRRLVLSALAELSHATPEEILAHVQRESAELNLSTVYRTLDVLAEVGLVTHAHLGHGAPTYHSVDGDPHIHLVCRRCGVVRSVPLDVAQPLAARVLAGYGFDTDMTHMALHGTCADCRGQADSGSAGEGPGPGAPGSGSSGSGAPGSGGTGSDAGSPALEQP